MKLRAMTLRRMRADSSASASPSEAGRGRRSGPLKRIDSGVAWAISVSTEGMPSAASMTRSSSRRIPIWRSENTLVVIPPSPSSDLRLVGVGIEQRAELALVADAHLPQPAIAFGGLVDLAGLVGEGAVDLGHHAGHRCIHVRGRLDRLDHHRRVAPGKLAARLGQFDEDDVAELFLGEIGDADRGDPVDDLDPFM